MSKKKNKRRSMWIWWMLWILVFVTVIQNTSIMITEYEVRTEKITSDSEWNIVQLSDIHFISSPKQAERLLQLVQQADPDIIVITGDLIDTPKYTKQKEKENANPIGEETILFCKRLAQTAPTYFVYGNHEMSLLDNPEKNAFKLSLQDVGIKIINNQSEVLEIEGNRINLLGVQDPSTLYKDTVYAHKELSNQGKVLVILDDLYQETDTSLFTLVLCHRPEYFEMYTEYDMDLLLAGHAHGGQFRLPFIREGLVAPGQGLFPKYTSGEYKSGEFTMIVSRGIGNSIVPVRIFNTPEVVKITVKGN